MIGFLLNAGVGKDVGSCATHMNAVGCHLPFSAVVSLGEHKASGPQAAARSRMGLWIEEVYPQYFSMSYHQKRGRAQRSWRGVACACLPRLPRSYPCEAPGARCCSIKACHVGLGSQMWRMVASASATGTPCRSTRYSITNADTRAFAMQWTKHFLCWLASIAAKNWERSLSVGASNTTGMCA